MSDHADFAAIFNEYCHSTIEESPGGTPIAVFHKSAATPVNYASGHGFVLSPGFDTTLAYTLQSLDRKIAIAEAVFPAVPISLLAWKDARRRLEAAMLAKQEQRLTA